MEIIDNFIATFKMLLSNIDNILSNIHNILNSNNIILIFILLLILLFFVLYIIYIINPFSISDNKFTIIGILIFIFLELQILFYFINHDKSNYFNNYIKIFYNSSIAIGLILFTIYTIFYICNNFLGKNYLTNIILIILIAFFIVTVLSIIYLVSSNNDVKNSAGKLDNEASKNNNYNFLKKLIFFIPCLLIDFVNSIAGAFTSTPKIGYILFILMIILVFLLFTLPNFLNNLINKSNLILKGPIYLNNRENLGLFQEFSRSFKPDISNYKKDFKISNYSLDINFEKYNEKIPFSYNYDLECEIYINPQPTNTNYSYNKYTNILSYGGKPQILYFGKENKLKITCQTDKNKSEVIYEREIKNNDYFKLLKWNKVLIKYDGANMDVFINSHLVATKSNIIPHMNYDKILVGENDGIYGGIKNVYFYNHNKPVEKIDNSEFKI
jgi:hypothetical protein